MHDLERPQQIVQAFALLRAADVKQVDHAVVELRKTRRRGVTPALEVDAVRNDVIEAREVAADVAGSGRRDRDLPIDFVVPALQQASSVSVPAITLLAVRVEGSDVDDLGIRTTGVPQNLDG